MNPTSFYNKKKNRVSARPVLNPELSDGSDLSSESDESIYISESESDYEDNSESTESHSQSYFSESNDELLVKPNTLPQPKTGALKKAKQQALQWKTAKLGDVILKDIPFTGNPPLESLTLSEPVNYFRNIISDEVIMRIFEDSNRYAAQVYTDKPLNLTFDELEQFIGILFLTSVVRMQATRDYWEQSLQYDRLASITTIRKFKRIKKSLHCNHNEKIDKDFPDKLFNIRLLIDALEEKFHLLVPTELLCIDEQMVPFKG